MNYEFHSLKFFKYIYTFLESFSFYGKIPVSNFILNLHSTNTQFSKTEISGDTQF